RRLGELRMELCDEARLPEARLAYDQDELTFARPSALPATDEHAQFLLAAYERRERPSAAPSAAPAGANDAEEFDRWGYAFEFASALLLDYEETGDLSLDVHGDEH